MCHCLIHPHFNNDTMWYIGPPAYNWMIFLAFLSATYFSQIIISCNPNVTQRKENCSLFSINIWFSFNIIISKKLHCSQIWTSDGFKSQQCQQQLLKRPVTQKITDSGNHKKNRKSLKQLDQRAKSPSSGIYRGPLHMLLKGPHRELLTGSFSLNPPLMGARKSCNRGIWHFFMYSTINLTSCTAGIL